MGRELPKTIVDLLNKGVKIPNPLTVEIGNDVDVKRISGKGTFFCSGTVIRGKNTLISDGVILGYESPAVIVDCRIGPDVELRGGFFKNSVFLAGSVVSSGAQVREGCLLEEEASGNHCVGLKQTILFPFVTLGSQINFCDCLMAGGTSRKNHSEVGSSFIHFNYTPNQDKATASLIGDVPRGVMLREEPIFLGGQGGIVGPVRLGYGTVLAAGSICRRDAPQGRIVLSEGNKTLTCELPAGPYGNIARKVHNNVVYLANLLALREWYLHVRQPFFNLRESGKDLFSGSIEILDGALKERLLRFKEFAEKLEASIRTEEKIRPGREAKKLLGKKKELLENWSKLEACFTDGRENEVAPADRNLFIQAVNEALQKGVRDYILFIQGLENNTALAGTAWLESIVCEVTNRALGTIPSYRQS
jgi:bifunctional UDP-N-acetylglucosamine pyrophosphorylase / glucosamine-1-phosphate N-acetyltransferase